MEQEVLDSVPEYSGIELNNTTSIPPIPEVWFKSPHTRDIDSLESSLRAMQSQLVAARVRLHEAQRVAGRYVSQIQSKQRELRELKESTPVPDIACQSGIIADRDVGFYGSGITSFPANRIPTGGFGIVWSTANVVYSDDEHKVLIPKLTYLVCVDSNHCFHKFLAFYYNPRFDEWVAGGPHFNSVGEACMGNSTCSLFEEAIRERRLEDVIVLAENFSMTYDYVGVPFRTLREFAADASLELTPVTNVNPAFTIRSYDEDPIDDDYDAEDDEE